MELQRASEVARQPAPLAGDQAAPCVEAARISSAQVEYLCEGLSPLVVELCYEHYLEVHGMLVVLAEQRGDDPEDTLGPSDSIA